MEHTNYFIWSPKRYKTITFCVWDSLIDADQHVQIMEETFFLRIFELGWNDLLRIGYKMLKVSNVMVDRKKVSFSFYYEFIKEIGWRKLIYCNRLKWLDWMTSGENDNENENFLFLLIVYFISLNIIGFLIYFCNKVLKPIFLYAEKGLRKQTSVRLN